MKKPVVYVKINDGEHKGREALITGYDRNKYFEVTFTDNGEVDYFKGYYLTGIEKLKYNHRYFLQDCDSDEVMTNKELWADYKRHTRRNFLSKKRHEFQIWIWDDKDKQATKKSFNKLNFTQLKTKMRYAIQNKLSFSANVTMYRTNGGFSWEDIVEVSIKNRNYWLPNTRRFKDDKKYLASFERGIVRLVEGKE